MHFLLGAFVILSINVHDVNAASGNVTVNINGNISYAVLPDGLEYSTPATFDEGSFPLPTTWDFIGSFLKTVSPGTPPYGRSNILISFYFSSSVF